MEAEPRKDSSLNSFMEFYLRSVDTEICQSCPLGVYSVLLKPDVRGRNVAIELLWEFGQTIFLKELLDGVRHLDIESVLRVSNDKDLIVLDTTFFTLLYYN